MALDLELLEANAQTANDHASMALVAIRKLRANTVAGVEYTAGQQTALRNEVDTDARLTQTAIDAVVAHLDAN